MEDQSFLTIDDFFLRFGVSIKFLPHASANFFAVVFFSGEENPMHHLGTYFFNVEILFLNCLQLCRSSILFDNVHGLRFYLDIQSAVFSDNMANFSTFSSVLQAKVYYFPPFDVLL